MHMLQVLLKLLVIVATGYSDENSSVHTSPTFSSILNGILLNYDSRQRPSNSSEPTEIQAGLMIRSMGPVSEVDMTYSLDAYFRQRWVDDRLRFTGDIPEITIHIKMLDLIWKPDTHFYNSRGATIHTMTTPNKLLRISQDGSVLYSMRITIKANCPMYLQQFPLDKQHCPLLFGSYAYDERQVKYKWHTAPIDIAKKMSLSQFDLTEIDTKNKTKERNAGVYSVLEVMFTLERNAGYFLIQLYVPCILIVVISWVSFWINREATGDRIGLGVTTVLTLTAMTMDSRQDLPKVSYATALDWFIITCFLFVIGTMLEFACVHFFTKYGSGENVDDDVIAVQDSPPYQMKCQWRSSQEKPSSFCAKISSYLAPVLKCVTGDSKYRHELVTRGAQKRYNSVSVIDRMSRFLFPLSFLVFNITYWIVYDLL